VVLFNCSCLAYQCFLPHRRWLAIYILIFFAHTVEFIILVKRIKYYCSRNFWEITIGIKNPAAICFGVRDADRAPRFDGSDIDVFRDHATLQLPTARGERFRQFVFGGIRGGWFGRLCARCYCGHGRCRFGFLFLFLLLSGKFLPCPFGKSLALHDDRLFLVPLVGRLDFVLT